MSELIEVQDNVRLENKHVQQIIAAIKGYVGFGVPFKLTNYVDAATYALDVKNGVTPGLHLRVTHSSGSPVLFQVTDAGVLISPDGVIPATNPYVYKGMVVGWDSVFTCPTGYAVCDGTGGTPDLRDRFIVGSGSSYALAATGGSATVNLQHPHAMPHVHPMAHTHSHHHSMNHHHTFVHDHDLGDHRHQFSHEHTFVHNHGANTNRDGSFSSTDKVGTDATFDNNDTNHRHGIPDESGSTTTRGGPDGGGSNNFTESGKPDSRGGFTGPPDRGTGTLVNASTYANTSGQQQNTSWTLINDTTGSGNNTDDDASASSAANTGAESTPNTSNALSPAQSILPPYYAMIWIKRTV